MRKPPYRGYVFVNVCWIRRMVKATTPLTGNVLRARDLLDGHGFRGIRASIRYQELTRGAASALR